MLSATDSFIQYLSTGLAGSVPVAWNRATSTDPATSEFQMGALNVSILGYYQSGRLEMPLVSLDLIGSDERTVLRQAKLVRDLLLDQQYIPEIDYDTVPATPSAVGHCVYWNAAEIDFKIISSSARSIHLNATFEILHVRQ